MNLNLLYYLYIYHKFYCYNKVNRLNVQIKSKIRIKMKFNNALQLLVIALILSIIVSKSFLKNKKNTEKSSKEKINILAETYTNDNGKSSLAVTDANAQVAYTGGELEGYYTPRVVNHLQDEVLPNKVGPLEPSDEIPTPHDYYDGGLKLNVVNVKCNIYANKTDCIHNSYCGWCGSSNSCMFGTKFGPDQPCVKSSFIFGQSYPNWNPQTRSINEPVGGVSATIISNPTA